MGGEVSVIMWGIIGIMSGIVLMVSFFETRRAIKKWRKRNGTKAGHNNKN